MWLQKGKMKGPFASGSVLYLDCINIHMLIVTIVLQDSNSRGTQGKGIPLCITSDNCR